MTGDAGVAKQLTVVARGERVNLPPPPLRAPQVLWRGLERRNEDNASEIFFPSQECHPTGLYTQTCDWCHTFRSLSAGESVWRTSVEERGRERTKAREGAYGFLFVC